MPGRFHAAVDQGIREDGGTIAATEVEVISPLCIDSGVVPEEVMQHVAKMLGVDLSSGYDKLKDVFEYIFKAGHEAGIEAGNERVKELFNQIYITGLDAGIQAGREKGIAEGRQSGYEEGLEAGQCLGRDAAYSEGFSAGRDAGLKEAIEVINQTDAQGPKP